jgi:hypothetical protein
VLPVADPVDVTMKSMAAGFEETVFSTRKLPVAMTLTRIGESVPGERSLWK